jgi:signal transduction histidine kinase
LQTTEQRILEMVASGRDLDQVLTDLLLSIEKHIPQTLGSILLLDPEKLTVRVAAAPHLPAGFNEAIEGEPIGPAAGSCGTAAYLKQAVFSRDIATDPLWEAYREPALRFGLRACWSTPILSSEGRVLGTFALYYREPKMPEPEELDLIARVTHVAGIAIQRKQLDDRLRALTGHIEAAREEERTAMAREIHDELGQSLTAMKMDVAWLGRHVQAGPGTREGAVEARISGMSTLIDGVVQQVRRISAELRPGVLDDLGLAAAIEWQTRDFSERSGVACTAQSNVSDMRFDRNLSTAVFRILQEALTNVARHAQAAHVDVSLVEEAGRLRLEVLDDGLGIQGDVLARSTSLGLLGMHERAHRLGGTLSVSSRPGKGTSIVVNMPVNAEEPR